MPKKKNSKNKARYVIVPIFNVEWSVLVVFGTASECVPVLEKYGYDASDIPATCFDTVHGMHICNPGLMPAIVMPKYPEKPREFATLAHEAVHAIATIYKRISEQDLDTEVFALSVGAIVTAALTLENIRQDK